jgi:hypothetical protein
VRVCVVIPGGGGGTGVWGGEQSVRLHAEPESQGRGASCSLHRIHSVGGSLPRQHVMPHVQGGMRVCVWSDHIVGVTELTKALLSCHLPKRGSRWLSALHLLCVLLVGAW